MDAAENAKMSVQTKSEPDTIEIVLADDFRKAGLSYTAEEVEAMTIRALENGQFDEQLVGWKEQDTLLWDYTKYEIFKEAGLELDILWISLETKADALAWIVDRKMSIPTVTLFEKIGDAKPFGMYWQEKYDKEHPVCKAALQRFGVIDALGIIAVKAGTSRVTVNKVNRILESDNEDAIKACREMEMSISSAYDLINGGDSDGEKDGGNSQDEAPDKEVLKAKKEKRQKRRQKEVDVLANYCVMGFTSKKVKLDKNGLKFFVLRWNDEHLENCISEKDVQKAIDNFGKDEK